MSAYSVDDLYEATSYRLRSYAVSILAGFGRVSEAEDAVHAAFEWMLRRDEQPVDSRAAEGSLFRATRNFCLQLLVDGGDLAPKNVKTPRARVGLIPEFVPTRLDDYETAEQRATFVRALRKLTPRELQVFLRCECRGDSAIEVSDELGMQKQQVYLTLYKARNRMAWHIEHGDRPFYADGDTGLRKTLVSESRRSESEQRRARNAHNRGTYLRRQVALNA